MPDKDHIHHADVTVDPEAEARLEHSRAQSKAAKGLLPGVAGICMFMLLVSLVGAFGAMRGVYPGPARIVVLAICTMMIVGVYGLLRLKRWGWALVIGGCLMMSIGYAYVSHAMHNPGLLIMSAFSLCFFLYLSRTEVRDRLR